MRVEGNVAVILRQFMLLNEGQRRTFQRTYTSHEFLTESIFPALNTRESESVLLLPPPSQLNTHHTSPEYPWT